MAINNIKREDLCVAHKPVLPPIGLYPDTPSIGGLINQSMPMAAIFLRNKFIGWFSFLQSIYFLLNTSAEELALSKSSTSNPSPLDQSPMIKVVISLIGLCVCYYGLVFPQNLAPPPIKETKIAESNDK